MECYPLITLGGLIQREDIVERVPEILLLNMKKNKETYQKTAKMQIFYFKGPALDQPDLALIILAILQILLGKIE
jgi:hypothetical protein